MKKIKILIMLCLTLAILSGMYFLIKAMVPNAFRRELKELQNTEETNCIVEDKEICTFFYESENEDRGVSCSGSSTSFNLYVLVSDTNQKIKVKSGYNNELFDENFYKTIRIGDTLHIKYVVHFYSNNTNEYEVIEICK